MDDFYSSGDGSPNLCYSEIAILTSTCNKYAPGKQTFYLQSINPMNEKNRGINKVTVNNDNIQNQDSSSESGELEMANNIVLDLPKDIARWYPTKWIPPGTRFIVSFIGGDLTKPQIVGRDF